MKDCSVYLSSGKEFHPSVTRISPLSSPFAITPMPALSAILEDLDKLLERGEQDTPADHQE